MPEPKKKPGRPRRGEYISPRCKLCDQPGEIMPCGSTYCAECVELCQIDHKADDCENCRLVATEAPTERQPQKDKTENDIMSKVNTATPIWSERAADALADAIREEGAKITDLAISGREIDDAATSRLNRLVEIKRELAMLANGGDDNAVMGREEANTER